MKLQGIFKRIHVSERKRLARELALHRVNLLCRFEDYKFVVQASVFDESSKVLLCLPGEEAPPKDFSEIVYHFQFEEHQYFFTSSLLRDPRKGLVVPTEVDFFILQRRASARIDIPIQYSALFRIQKFNGVATFVEAKIIDVSAGGLKIALMDNIIELKSGDKIDGVLRLGNRAPIEMKCEVRYVTPRASDKEAQVCGVMFLNMNTLMENKLLTILMNLQHELFTKYQT